MENIKQKKQQNMLYENNKNIVYDVLKKYFQNYYYDIDAIEVGKEYLLLASKRYNKTINNNFTAYAYSYVINGLRKYLKKEYKYAACVFFEDVENNINFSTSVDNINYKIGFKEFYNNLTSDEKKVIMNLSKGNNYRQYAKTIKTSKDKIFRIVSSIKKKYKIYVG